MEKAIITVVGKDKVGIMAKTCSYLAENSINIRDISQTVVKEYFNMMMIVEINSCDKSISSYAKELENLGKKIGVEIKLQPEQIFTSMHRI